MHLIDYLAPHPCNPGPKSDFCEMGPRLRGLGGSIFQMSLRLHGSPTGRAQRMQEGSWRMRGIGGWGGAGKEGGRRPQESQRRETANNLVRFRANTPYRANAPYRS